MTSGSPNTVFGFIIRTSGNFFIFIQTHKIVYGITIWEEPMEFLRNAVISNSK